MAKRPSITELLIDMRWMRERMLGLEATVARLEARCAWYDGANALDHVTCAEAMNGGGAIDALEDKLFPPQTMLLAGGYRPRAALKRVK